MLKQVIIILLCLSTNMLFAQNDVVLRYFNAQLYNNKIVLDWSLEKGSLCNGIEILHSTDSIAFVQIGKIEGICGDTTDSKGYTFTHHSPVENRRNYYRLILGGATYSNIIGINFYLIGEEAYLIFPNPYHENGKILVNNPGMKNLELEIINQSGTFSITDNLNNSEILLEKYGLAKGYYFFTLKGLNIEVIQGRFIKF